MSLEDIISKHPALTGLVVGSGLAAIGSGFIEYFQSIYGGESDYLHLFSIAYSSIVGLLTWKTQKKNAVLKDYNLSFSMLKKKVKPKKKLGIDLFSYYPYVAGYSIALLSGAFIWGQKILNNVDKIPQILHDKPEQILSNILIQAGYFLGIGKVLQLASDFIEPKSRVFKRKMFLTNILSKISPLKADKYIRNIDEPFGLNEFSLKIASLKQDSGATINALDLILESYNQSELENLPSDFSSRWYRDQIYEHTIKIGKNPESYANYVLLSFTLNKLGLKSFVNNSMSQMLSVADKDESVKKEANLSHAVFLMKTGLEGFETQFKKVLDLYENKITQIGNFKAFYIKDSEFSKKTFIIRKSKNIDELLDEKDYNQAIKKKFDSVNDDEVYRIIDTPKIVEHKGMFYLATFFEDGQNFYDFTKNSYNKKQFEDLARFLARIHGSNGLNKSISGKELLSSFRGSEDLYGLFSKLGYVPQVVDVDGHRQNWIVGMHYTKIDNQKRPLTIPSFEISKLLEQGNRVPINHEGDVFKDEIVKVYLSELKNFGFDMSANDFLELKLISDAIKADSYYHFSKGDDSKRTPATQFLQNSIHSMQRLGLTEEKKYLSSLLDNLSA